jgi:regulator of sirC expression with transglutaminase-like and TPR domain
MSNPEFRSAVQRPAAEIDLAQAALLYARDAYPDLDPVLYLNQLDEWAEDIRTDIGTSIDPVATLNRFLFDDLRFQAIVASMAIRATVISIK